MDAIFILLLLCPWLICFLIPLEFIFQLIATLLLGGGIFFLLFMLTADKDEKGKLGGWACILCILGVILFIIGDACDSKYVYDLLRLL